MISCSSYASDGRSEAVRVSSNGFRGVEAGAWFAAGGDMTLTEIGEGLEAGYRATLWQPGGAGAES